jgi:hypothetical protein
MNLKLISAEQVHASLHYPEFIDDLQLTFAAPHTMPPRQVMLLDSIWLTRCVCDAAELER